jgi:ABC-2 type transport system permease protein
MRISVASVVTANASPSPNSRVATRRVNPNDPNNTTIGFGKVGNFNGDYSLGLIQSVAGTAIFMLLFSVAEIGGSLLDEKQEGMLKKLLCSPLRSIHILYGKMVFANIISIAQLSIIFVYAWLVFGMDIMHHLPSVVLMIIVTGYACSSFGVFLASFSKSRQQVQGLSKLIVLIMSGIGGSMIPVFMMPEFMQKISVFSVNYWGVQGFYDIFWRLLPLADITFLSRVVALISIGTLLNFIALQMLKKNILKIV